MYIFNVLLLLMSQSFVLTVAFHLHFSIGSFLRRTFAVCALRLLWCCCCWCPVLW